MKILLASATEAEIAPLLEFLGRNALREGTMYHLQNISVRILVTGIGPVSTSFALAKELSAASFGLALQAGIAGSFDPVLKPGSLVQVSTECFGDLGAEDHGDFLSVFELGLTGKDDFPFRGGELNSAPEQLPFHCGLPPARGLTVSTVSGRRETIDARVAAYGCQVESMEGAAFHYACLQEQLPFLQVRAISNYVEPRNRAGWKIPEAIKALNDWLIQLFTETLKETERK